MLISEIIQIIKDHHYNEIDGHVIQESTTRDKVLYGDINKHCTGIVTTIYASVDVIKKAAELGANLIIAHESLFWNHGDHTDWLKDNKTFQMKKDLLDQNGITVWRDHDYIHAGVYWKGKRVDGIFYGLAEELEWESYIVEEDPISPLIFEIPPAPTKQVAQYLMKKMNLNGIRCMGNLHGMTHRILLPMHLMGSFDNEVLTKIEEKQVDTILAMEITDFTVSIYIRDGAMLGLNKVILSIGHFNIEEPGMKWFGQKYLPTILHNDVPITFIQAGDSYTMLLRS